MSVPTQLELQTCAICGHVQYPNRELCARCLSDEIAPQAVDNRGRLASWTAVHASLDPLLQERTPWRVGAIALDCGPLVIAYLAVAVDGKAPALEVTRIAGPGGQRVLVAYPVGGSVPTDLFSLQNEQ